ncbi:MAG: ABC transporter ATP-binding protein [Candidatus Omnitrophota bacterium]
MQETIFALDNVHYAYLGKFPALCGIDMQVKRGEKIAIVGANGTGKSTLLHLLDALIFPDKGNIKAFGTELDEASLNKEEFCKYFRSRVGFIFQNPDVQLFSPSVKEDIVFGPLQLGLEKEVIKSRLEELTCAFGIEDLLERPPHRLSTGEKRKVAIASVLISEPQVVILDEPTAGLDPATVRQIIDILIEYNEKGKTIITSTHDLHIVEEIADTVYLLNKEKKIACSLHPHDLLNNVDLLRENNLIHIHPHKHKDKIHAHPHLHLGDHHHEEI